MRRLILLFPIFLTACGEPLVEYVPVRPDIPADLLRPCPISDRVAETYRDLAVLATEHLTSARCGNDKLASVGEILNDQ